MNIKFEVQVLCKNINIKIDDIPKTNLLLKCKMNPNSNDIIKPSNNPPLNSNLDIKIDDDKLRKS